MSSRNKPGEGYEYKCRAIPVYGDESSVTEDFSDLSMARHWASNKSANRSATVHIYDKDGNCIDKYGGLI